MAETGEQFMPGMATPYVERGERGFSKIAMLLEATGGLSLSQVCAVTGLENSTIQNWVKRGWVAHPLGKRYEEVHIARILIINALKECIKLEHIALLMSYVNGSADNSKDEGIIKESELYNYLCDALRQMGQAADHSRVGAESVVDIVIKDYAGPRPDSRIRIRKALTLMIFACVCTDVKRRTEAMMGQILSDLENPANLEAEVAKLQDANKAEAARAFDEAIAAAQLESANAEAAKLEEPENTATTRKTVSQALREWDFSSVERTIIDPEEITKTTGIKPAEEEKPSNRPWYLRRSTKN